MSCMINFGVYIWRKSMLSVTPGKKCCIIKSMSPIIEFISLNIQIQSEEIDRVTKCERVICQPECLKVILNSERVKTCLLLCLNFHFCVYHDTPNCVYRYLKEKKTSKTSNLKMLSLW